MSDTELLADGCVSIQNAIAFTSLGRSKLYTAMEAGELAFVRKGGRRMIPRRALVEYMRSGLIGAPGSTSRDRQPAAATA